MKRIFLGWNRPALPSVVDFLAAAVSPGALLDLSKRLCVVPGARASRRLLELLVLRAEEDEVDLVPPEIITIGALPERVLGLSSAPIAGDQEQANAWIHALSADPESAARIAGDLPQDDDAARFALAAMIGELRRELASERISFDTAATACDESGQAREGERWRALASLERAYLDALKEAGLEDRHAAREKAFSRGIAGDGSEILLIACADLGRQLRAVVELAGARAAALVFAPEELADRFDALGCLRPGAWTDLSIPYSLDDVTIAEKPEDQAVAAVFALDSFGGAYSADQITIGAPDSRVTPALAERLERCRIPHHAAIGWPVGRTLPCRLSSAVRDFVDGRRFEELAALLRHPDVEWWLESKRHRASRQSSRDDWIAALDRIASERLPHSAGDPCLRDAHTSGPIASILGDVDRWLGEFDAKRQAIGMWAPAIRGMLTTVYDTARDADDPDTQRSAAALDAIGAALDGFERAAVAGPAVDAAGAISAIIASVTSAAVPELPAPGAIDIVGWLELLLDDALAVVVTGLNEGHVPESISSDAFLPNSLRQQLGIADNDRRIARDAYLLSTLVASRETLRIILGRKTAEGDTLVPSRLLLHGDDALLPDRIRRLVVAKPQRSLAAPGDLDAGRDRLDFPIPQPLELPLEPPIKALPVTAFRDYLACPFGFYLKHVRKLRSLDDRAEELDGGAFGDLAHRVLEGFGKSAAAGVSDEAMIRETLDDILDRIALERFGPAPRPAIRIQIEQLRRRLEAFATWQAKRTADGWTIAHTELAITIDAPAEFVVDDLPMAIVGRIDRIDVHRFRSGCEIFDYKTSDRGDVPDKVHRRRGAWVDLQLPLYRHLARSAGISGPVKLGYIALPKNPADVGAKLAEWTDVELDDADATAERVIRAIRRRVFFPPRSPVPRSFKDFAAIYQEGSLAPMVGDEDEAESEEASG